ncbi:MAG: SemiSWEET family sugar transporter [Hyphomonadaceae bacterium]
MAQAPDWLINGSGAVAGLCSMASFVPQLIKIAQERAAPGISTRMFAITVVGFGCWTIYGLFSQSWPVAISNTVSGALAAAILALRLRYGDASD